MKTQIVENRTEKGLQVTLTEEEVLELRCLLGTIHLRGFLRELRNDLDFCSTFDPGSNFSAIKENVFIQNYGGSFTLGYD